MIRVIIKRHIIILGLASFLSLTSIQGFAADSGNWEFSVAPLYLWAKSIDGSGSLGVIAAPLDLDFQDDIFENIDGAFAIHFEARKDQLTLFAEYNYAELDPSPQVTIDPFPQANIGPITVNTDMEVKDTMWEVGVAYAFSESGSTRWEILGGARYWEQELDAKNIDYGIDGPGILPSRISGGDDWWHVFGGVRVNHKLTERWSLQARADYGYQDSDNKATNLAAFADYRFRQWGSFFAGYRYLDNDYDNTKGGKNQYSASLTQQGPTLGVNFHF